MAGLSPGKGEGVSQGKSRSAIGWLPWNNRAFQRAQQEDKPVFLSITAVWCYWCHVMEENTYADAEVAEYIRENFVPVQVDNDHRPDVNARYNVGGWPTTAFLTPHGGYMAGATYLPPDQLLAMLREVRRAYDDDKAGLYDQAAQLHRQRQEYVGRVESGYEVSHRLVDVVARRMAGAYDARNGGFGEDLKFPSAPVLRLLLHLYRTTREDFYRAMLAKTLDAMLSGELYDGVEGGFFRYCAQEDWTAAQHEKMLEDNTGVARALLDAGILLEDERYLSAARATIDYLLATLFDSNTGGFRGSQGAHSEYFGMPEEVRGATEPPATDSFCYTGWTCQAISLLLEASWKLGNPQWAETALASLERVAGRFDGSRMPHVFDGTGRPSPQLSDDTDLLGDWAAYLNALMDAHHFGAGNGAYLERAEAAVEHMDGRFYDRSRGAYFDIPADPDAVGYMRLLEKPLAENMQAVEGLVKLHHATGDGRYRQQAENVLGAYTEANRDFGEHAASYAVAVDLFLHSPLEITIEGELGRADTSALATAALRVSYPHLVLKPSPSLPGTPAVAHVCVDTLCYPPVSQPEELAASVQEALEGPQTPAENIFERFVSF